MFWLYSHAEMLLMISSSQTCSDILTIAFHTEVCNCKRSVPSLVQQETVTSAVNFVGMVTAPCAPYWFFCLCLGADMLYVQTANDQFCHWMLPRNDEIFFYHDCPLIACCWYSDVASVAQHSLGLCSLCGWTTSHMFYTTLLFW